MRGHDYILVLFITVEESMVLKLKLISALNWLSFAAFLASTKTKGRTNE
jgi:hypothetical protein